MGAMFNAHHLVKWAQRDLHNVLLFWQLHYQLLLINWPKVFNK
jgi:hypothetical protein